MVLEPLILGSLQFIRASSSSQRIMVNGTQTITTLEIGILILDTWLYYQTKPRLREAPTNVWHSMR